MVCKVRYGNCQLMLNKIEKYIMHQVYVTITYMLDWYTW